MTDIISTSFTDMMNDISNDITINFAKLMDAFSDEKPNETKSKLERQRSSYKKYNQSEKGKLRKLKYEKSRKGRKTRSRYNPW